MVLQRVHTKTSAISIVLLMSTCSAMSVIYVTAAAAAAKHLLEVHMFNAALARRALAFGAGQRWVLARVFEDFKTTALTLVLVEVAAPHGGAARSNTFAAVADELQTLKQRA